MANVLLIEWIIPHSGGEDQALSIGGTHPRQPAQLDEDTSLHGIPAPEDTPRTLATKSLFADDDDDDDNNNDDEDDDDDDDGDDDDDDDGDDDDDDDDDDGGDDWVSL